MNLIQTAAKGIGLRAVPMQSSKKIDPFNYIDAAMQFTSDAHVVRVADRQWTDIDQLVTYILDFIPEAHKDAYMEMVTRPNF